MAGYGGEIRDKRGEGEERRRENATGKGKSACELCRREVSRSFVRVIVSEMLCENTVDFTRVNHCAMGSCTFMFKKYFCV